MRKFLLTLSAIIAVSLISCNKDLQTKSKFAEKNCELTIKVQPGLSAPDNISKATGADHGNQGNDNTINTLEIFVFDKSADGVLDAYSKLTSVTDLNNIKIKTTTGEKVVYVVANSHKDKWTDATTLAKFKSHATSLTKDNLKDFVMTGSVETVINLSSTITIPISRLAARVKLSSIKAEFKGTAYEGMNLSNIKAYIINVHSSKYYHNGESDTPVILNGKKAVASDNASCAMNNMLYDDIPQTINDGASYSEKHFFYAYENLKSTETATDRFTRLVVQADLNGKTYYYPVNINQEGYGYTSSNGHYGVKRNRSYELNITIKKPGSDDPDKPLEQGTVTCTINVEDWVDTVVANPEF